MSVTITKQGFTATEWDSDIREYTDKPIRHIYHELRTVCHIHPEVTLRDIIAFVYRDPSLRLLIGNYAWCDVQAFYEEVITPSSKNSDLQAIELSRFIEIDRNGDVDEIIHVSGVGPDQEGKITNNWAIEWTPVYEMADTPIRLHPTVEIQDSREITPEGVRIIHKGNTCFTLLEVLGELFFEISFLGSPKQRNEEVLQIEQAMDEIKNGTAKLHPFESAFDDDDKPKIQ